MMINESLVLNNLYQGPREVAFLSTWFHRNIISCSLQHKRVTCFYSFKLALAHLYLFVVYCWYYFCYFRNHLTQNSCTTLCVIIGLLLSRTIVTAEWFFNSYNRPHSSNLLPEASSSVNYRKPGLKFCLSINRQIDNIVYACVSLSFTLEAIYCLVKMKFVRAPLINSYLQFDATLGFFCTFLFFLFLNIISIKSVI